MGCKWCGSKSIDNQGEHILPTTPIVDENLGRSTYIEFYADGKGCIDFYNGISFISAGEFDFNIKEGSANNIIEIKNIGGLEGNNTTLEIISSTEMKMNEGELGYVILTKDYYNL